LSQPLSLLARDVSQCSTCLHLRSWVVTGTVTSCGAYPQGMPDAVWANTLDHRRPIDGDRGVRWESNGEAYPGERGWDESWERIAGEDTHPGGEGLKHYWTESVEGLAKWADGPHPYTALYHHLLKHMDGNELLAHKTAGAWYFKVFGHGPTAGGRSGTKSDHKSDHWKEQLRDPGGADGGRWVKSPGGWSPDVLQGILDAAAGRDDPRPGFAALKMPQLKAVLGHAGLPKSGKKADIVDRLVGHVKRDKRDDLRAGFAALKVTDLKGLLAEAGLPKTGKKADLVDRLVEHKKAADADESLRRLGADALGEVPASGVPGDARPGDVLHEPGGADKQLDSGADPGPRGDGTAGRDVYEEDRPAELGSADGGGTGATGDPAQGGGRRGPDVAPVFRPAGQGDLAPSGEMARLRANMDALRTLRRIQSEGRPATADEQSALARWSGWGALPKVFDTNPANPKEWDRKWGPAQRELKELLSEQEYAAANRSILNAHYTDANYVDAMWDAVGKLGFDGGRVLEPGSGSGNFMGRAPDGAHMVGVELDPTTAAISQALYPNAQVRAESFADTRLDDGTFDVTVGNVPFAEGIRLADPRHNKGKHSIHNHFILKSLHLTRPGGLVAVLTSRYTLDSRNPAARREMAELGDLVGAVRLPSGAHQRAAGTAVVTDLLVFRRREPGAAPAGLPFEQSRPVDVNGTQVAINEVFHEHPDLVLGKLALGGMHYANDLTVDGDSDAGPALRDALDKIVGRAKANGLTMTAADGESRTEPDLIPLSEQQPDGYIRALPDGTFSQVRGATAKPFTPPKAQAAELRALLHLRDVELALLDEESANADDTEKMGRLRAELNDAYDGYVAEYGPINRYTATRTGKTNPETGEPIMGRRHPAQGGFREDPYAAAVKGLENYDPAQGTTSKADILYGRVAAPRERKLGADTPADALNISLDENGRVWLDEVARLLGVDNDTARRELGELVYDDPDTKELVPAPAYLSGNVREKLDAARLAAAENPEFELNVKALEQVLPPDLGATEIRAQLGATWIEPKYVAQFLTEILRDGSVRVENPYGSEWTVSGNKKTIAASSEWGTPDRSAIDIAESLLTLRPIRVTDVVDNGEGGEKRVLNPVKTEAANEKARAMGERFAEWVWEDPARADDMAATYNRTFNSLVLRTYSGVDPSLPGMSTRFAPHPHVKAAVARIIAEPSVGLWHEVGAGKTAVMTIGAMELRRLGLARKPAIVVPNHMLEQFRNEFLQIYPQARILAAGSDDLTVTKTRNGRREFIAHAATGNWDAVIITKDAFKSIPLSAEAQEAFLLDELKVLDEAIDRARTAARHAGYGKDKQAKEKTVKQIEAAKQKAEVRIKANIAKAKKDPGITFELTGIDYLLIDEAHNYKNLRRTSAIEGMGIPGNGIATDLHMKIGHLRQRNPHHVVTLATATPIANSMGEAHTMMKFLRPDLLESLRITDFDSFAAQFGTVVTGVEPAPEGGWRIKSRFAKFVNVPELLRPWGIAGDVKTAEDLEHIVKPPKLAKRPKDGERLPEVVVVPPSEELKNLMAELGVRAKAIRTRGGKPEKGDDNMLNITREGRAGAFDLRLLGRSTPERSKVDVAAERIAEIWQENRDRVYPVVGKPGELSPTPGALQIVFADLGTPKPGGAEEGGSGFDLYEDLRSKLVAQGIPRERIRFIHEAKSDKEKVELFAAANDGRISVLVGSTGKMGTGANIQWRAVAMHHLDVPWRPADVQQREGRIIRQKNQNPEVRVLRYVTERSFDDYNWKTVARKAKFISQLMRGKLDVREIDDIGDAALTADEAAALADGNELLIDHYQAEAEVSRLERLERAHDNDHRANRFKISEAGKTITRAERGIAAVDAAIARRVDTRKDAFRMTVNGVEYDNRGEATAALRERLQALGTSFYGRRDLGEVGGFTIRVERDSYASGIQLGLVDVPESATVLGRAEILDGDLAIRLENTLRNLESVRARDVATIEAARHTTEEAQARLAVPFNGDALRAAREHFTDLDEAIRVQAQHDQEVKALAPEPTPVAPTSVAAPDPTIVAKLKEQFAAMPDPAKAGDTAAAEARKEHKTPGPVAIKRLPPDRQAEATAVIEATRALAENNAVIENYREYIKLIDGVLAGGSLAQELVDRLGQERNTARLGIHLAEDLLDLLTEALDNAVFAWQQPLT